MYINQNQEVGTNILINEIELGPMAGPFKNKPISNLRCLPIGVVPKKTDGFRLIAHLSYHKENDFIDARFTRVNYSSLDSIVNLIKRLGKGA